MAIGIDASAHCGAIYEKGKTIAVLGGGTKNIYPKENLWLYNKIIEEDGCIITEYGEDEETKPSNFSKRNRIISGIADAVLVIEANYRSGSGITARYARIQGKTVYCIPMNLDQKNSDGIRKLLNDGAKLVMSPKQLVKDLYGEDYNRTINTNKKAEIEEIPKQYAPIYYLIDAETSKVEIATKSKLSMKYINYILLMMELDGYIEQVSGNKYIRKI